MIEDGKWIILRRSLDTTNCLQFLADRAAPRVTIQDPDEPKPVPSTQRITFKRGGQETGRSQQSTGNLRNARLPARPARRTAAQALAIEMVDSAAQEANIDDADASIGYAIPFLTGRFPSVPFAYSQDKPMIVLLAAMGNIRFMIYPNSHQRVLVATDPDAAVMEDPVPVDLTRGDMMIYDGRLVISSSGTMLNLETVWCMVVCCRWPGQMESLDENCGSPGSRMTVVPHFKDTFYFAKASELLQ